MRPSSGTLILYDRMITRRYKDDGYRWVKKRNSNKVREDHVKLRVNGVNRVSSSYVHCMDNSSFHRRAYHLLLDENESSNELGDVNRLPKRSLVLVHYLENTGKTSRRVPVIAKTNSLIQDMNNPSVQGFASMVTSACMAVTNENNLLEETPEQNSASANIIYPETVKWSNVDSEQDDNDFRTLMMSPYQKISALQNNNLTPFPQIGGQSSDVFTIGLRTDNMLTTNALDACYNTLQLSHYPTFDKATRRLSFTTQFYEETFEECENTIPNRIVSPDIYDTPNNLVDEVVSKEDWYAVFDPGFCNITI